MATGVEELCEQHRGLPAVMSRQMAATAPPYVQPEDLEPAAWDGLYRAAVSWRPDGAAPFHTWAKYRIHGVIRDQMRLDDPLPRNRRVVHRGILDAVDQLTATHGRHPTDAEVAAAVGLTVAKVRARLHEYHTLGPPPLSVDNPAVLDVTDGSDPAAVAERAETEAWLRAAVAALPDKPRRTLEGIYWHDLPLAVIAADLGVSDSRVTQLHSEALRTVRAVLAYHLDGDDGPPLTGVVSRRRDAYRQAVADTYLTRARRGE